MSNCHAKADELIKELGLGKFVRTSASSLPGTPVSQRDASQSASSSGTRAGAESISKRIGPSKRESTELPGTELQRSKCQRQFAVERQETVDSPTLSASGRTVDATALAQRKASAAAAEQRASADTKGSTDTTKSSSDGADGAPTASGHNGGNCFASYIEESASKRLRDRLDSGTSSSTTASATAAKPGLQSDIHLPTSSADASRASSGSMQNSSNTTTNAGATLQPATAQELRNFVCTPYLHEVKISTELQTFIGDNFGGGAKLRAMEAGGGGDCLFHSFGAALEQMVQLESEAGRHVLETMALEYFTHSKRTCVKFLRSLVAEVVNRWQDMDMLNYVLNSVGQQKSGTWNDGYSPQSLLAEHGCGHLAAGASVRAVGPNPDGKEGDCIIVLEVTDPTRGSGTSVDKHIHVEDGVSRLAGLQATLAETFAMPGNMHWGTVADLQALVEKLNVGVLMFTEHLQCGGRRCLANLDYARGDFPYFICMWYDDRKRFRLAQHKPAGET